MSDTSTFESRIGKLACNASAFYSFITDIRNFRILIPGGAANNLVIEKES
jgi:hypothetical protein